MLHILGFTPFNIRAIAGPLSPGWCRFAATVAAITVSSLCLFALAISGIRFAFIFVYKTIPVMDDRFAAFFISLAINVESFMLTGVKLYLDDKPLIIEVSC